MTDTWATVWNSTYPEKYSWDLSLPGAKSVDREAARRCIAVVRVPESADPATALERLRSAMVAYLDAQDDYQRKGLLRDDEKPTFQRFARDIQRWLGTQFAGRAYTYGCGVGAT